MWKQTIKVGPHDPLVRPVRADGSGVTALRKEQRCQAIGMNTGQAEACSQNDPANKGTFPSSRPTLN